jgi:hypothetical protein
MAALLLGVGPAGGRIAFAQQQSPRQAGGRIADFA